MDYATLQRIIQETDAAYAAEGASDAVKQEQVAKRQAAVQAYRNRGSGQAQQAPVKSDYQLKLEQERADLGQNLAAYFKSVGLDSLAQWAIQSAREGKTEDWVRLNVRDRPEYKQRFPAMQHYIDNNLGFTEQQYIDYEQAARNLDQLYGLPDNMIYNAVTDLLVNEVSELELRSRAEMAGAAAVAAPEDFKRTMREYYGIEEGGLAAYFLDPDNVQSSLEKQSAAARTGAIAAQQNVPNVARDLAEDLYDQGIKDEAQIRQGFETVNTYRGLSSGKANTVTQEELIRGTFGQAEELEKIRRASKARINSQRGGGSYAASEGGNAGLR